MDIKIFGARQSAALIKSNQYWPRARRSSVCPFFGAGGKKGEAEKGQQNKSGPRKANSSRPQTSIPDHG